MTKREQRLHALTQAIIAYLEAHSDAVDGVDNVLKTLSHMKLTGTQPRDTRPRATRHDAVLQCALDNMTSPALQGISHSLNAARNDLVWREDEAQFYPPGADLGDGYRQCNLHALLVGPDAAAFHHADFCLGVFMLGPRTLYRDHRHAAPELYLNLSARSGWRFDTRAWQDYPAGSLIWNPSNAPHATRVYDEPFLSVFAWLNDISTPCQVIPRDDWAEIELALANA